MATQKRAPSGTRQRLAAGTTRKGTIGKPKNSPQAAGNKTRSSPARKPAGKPAARTPRQPKPAQPRLALSARQRGLISGIVLIFLTAILVLGVLSPNQSTLIRQLADRITLVFGRGSLIAPLLTGGLGGWLVLWGMGHPPQLPVRRVTGALLLMVTALAVGSLLVQWRDPLLDSVWQVAAMGRGGGYLGSLIARPGQMAVGTPGAILIYSLAALLGLVLLSGLSGNQVGHWMAVWRARRAAAPSADSLPPAPAPDSRTRPARAVSPPHTAEPLPEELLEAEAPDEAEKAPRRPPRTAPPPPPVMRQQPPAGRGEPESVKEVGPISADSTRSNRVQWELPDIARLLRPGSDPELSYDTIRQQAEIIEHTLESFGAPGRIVDTNFGPTVTQFGVEPLYLEARTGKRTKVKVSKIAGLADDLALALAAKSVRIEAPVPGKGYIGIEVPNSSKVIVSLRDIMEAGEFTRIKSPLRLGLGQDVAGNAIAADLAKMPHLLIAGATGSGKSVCVNTIIACLLLHNTPEELRFVMVDPKRVELTGYNGIPHLAAPVVVDMERVVGVLQWALREMDKRYQVFAHVGVRNLAAYNKLMADRAQDGLPHIVIIIDELADLMMTAPEETERALARLAQMARATGMHMIVATQRPSVDVVTGLIKANFPARIAFAVASAIDSRVILDQVGAERLLGQGDMLFQRPDAPAPLRMQGCYVSDEELNGLIRYWQSARRFVKYTAAETARPVEIPATVPTVAPVPTMPGVVATTGEEKGEEAGEKSADSPPAPTPAAALTFTPANSPPPAPVPAEPLRQPPLWEDLIEIEAQKPDDDGDELWEEVVTFVRKTGKASTSLLQRRFRIGYTRAARLIDRLEEAEIIGPPTGTSKARNVVGAEPSPGDDAGED